MWRISVKPTDAPDLLTRLTTKDVLLDWGGGLIWALASEGTDLRTAMAGTKGHATLVRSGPDTARRLGVFHPEPPGLTRISAGLRARFDPRGILNPGLMEAR